MPRFRQAVKPQWTARQAIEAFRRGYDAATRGGMRVLVIRRIGMGDVVQALITAEGLKRRYDCTLIFATLPEYFTLCERFSMVDEIIVWDGDAQYTEMGYDIVINLHDNVDFLPYCATAPRLDLMADTAQIEWGRLDFNLRIGYLPEDIQFGQTFIRRHNLKRPVIGLHTSSSSPLRQWNYAEKMAELLIENGFSVLGLNQIPMQELWGLDHAISEGVANVDRLMGLLSQCECVICVDSGVMHLCGITETPFISLFGPISPNLRISYFRRRRALWLEHLKCTPCHDWQLHSCHNREWEGQCMNGITPDMVLDTLQQFKDANYQ